MPTSPWCLRQFRDKSVTSSWFVRDIADFPVSCRGRRRFRQTCRQGDANGLVADLLLEFFKPSWHVAMVWNPRNFPVTWSMSATSPWLVADFPETSPWHISRGSFEEVGIMEFVLHWMNSELASAATLALASVAMLAGYWLNAPYLRVSYLYCWCWCDVIQVWVVTKITSRRHTPNFTPRQLAAPH